MHRQVLAAKDGLQKLPSSVYKTVDNVMKFFKNSHVQKEKLEAIQKWHQKTMSIID